MRYISAIALFVSVMPLFAEGPAEQLAQVTETKRVDFAPGGTIRWNNSYGALYIEGWDHPQVEITVIKSTHYFEPAQKDKETKRLETVQVVTERRSDTELVISTTVPTRKDWAPPLPRRTTNKVIMEYRVNVPRETRLVIDHRGGMVLAGNVTADIDVANSHGDITLMLPARIAYAIDAGSKMGHIASDFPGDTLSRWLAGQHFTGTNASPSRHLHLRTGFGGITIVAIPPEAEALSTAGIE